MANPPELTGIVTARAGEGLDTRVAWGALSRRLAATMLPLAILLAGFAAIERQLTAGGRDLLGFTSFWYHSGAMAFCYLFGLHWTEHRRILSAIAAATPAAAVMTVVTVVLTFVGIATGIVAVGIFMRLLSPDPGFLAVLILVPGLAGMAWGIGVAQVACKLATSGDVPPGWRRLHALWGAAAGPLMLFSTGAPRSPYVAAFMTTVATLALALASWRCLRRSRRQV